MGYSPGGLKELDTTELLHVFHFYFVLLKSQQSVKIQRQLQPRAEGRGSFGFVGGAPL